MDINLMRGLDNIPILVSVESEKHYFALDEQDFLKQFTCKNGNWNLAADNCLGQKVRGFDAALDSQNGICLLGYDQSGGLFNLSPPANHPAHSDGLFTEPFYRDSSKKIEHLSACIDRENNLHALCLSINKEQEMWWLLYFHQEKGTWQEPVIIDFGYHLLEQNGVIFRDLKENIFILYRLAEKENYRLALRHLPGKGSRPGRTFFLSEKHRDCFFPSFVVTPDNTLHFSWISQENNILFLNYVQKSSDGKENYFFSMEAPQKTLTIVSPYFFTEKLLLTCKKDNELFYLISVNKGENWKWGGTVLLGSNAQLVRLRSTNVSEQGPYVLIENDSPEGPPQKIWFPEEFLSNNLEKENLQKEFEQLDLLSLSLLTHAGNLQAANISLKEKLEKKGEELKKIYLWGTAMNEKAVENLNARKMELQQIETSFKKTLAELQNRVSREKETLTVKNKDLLKQIQVLHKKTGDIKKENRALLKNISELREQVVSLIAENEDLKAKKNGFFSNILNRLKG